jgi:hypothetical protein
MPLYDTDVTRGMLTEIFDYEQNAKLDKLYKQLDETNNPDIQLEIDAIENGDDDEAMPEWNRLPEGEQRIWIKKAVDMGLLRVDHGDGFSWLGQGYRNENLWFWHKTKGAIGPCTEYDDYGSVPKCFIVGDGEDHFEPFHWVGVVDHNNYVNLSKEIIEKIKENAKRENGEEHWKGTVTIRGELYPFEVQNINNVKNPFEFVDRTLYSLCG